MNMHETISIRDHLSIRTITLLRPEKRNALTRKMIEELTHAFVDCGTNNSIQVMILTGSGNAFCSGLDLADLQKMALQGESAQRADSDRIATMMRTLYACPVPTIAAVQGAAVAGGMGLATICDFTLATADAQFGYPEVRIGFIPALVSAFLTRQVGDKQARDLLLTGRLIDVYEAHRLGLVTRVVEEPTAIEAAYDLAESLLKNSPASLRATKGLLRRQSADALDRDLAAAAEANAAIRKTSEFVEGLSAFLEKRKPAWVKKP